MFLPEGPSTQYLRTLVPKAIKGMVFGTRVPKNWGPSGFSILQNMLLRWAFGASSSMLFELGASLWLNGCACLPGPPKYPKQKLTYPFIWDQGPFFWVLDVPLMMKILHGLIYQKARNYDGIVYMLSCRISSHQQSECLLRTYSTGYNADQVEACSVNDSVHLIKRR